MATTADRRRGVDTFSEYDTVQRRTADLDRLKMLYGKLLTPDQTERLISYLQREYRLPKLEIDFTGSIGTNGHYWIKGVRQGPRGGRRPAVVVLSRYGTNAEVVAHEYAHHLAVSGLQTGAKHDINFVFSLDRVAETVERWVRR